MSGTRKPSLGRFPLGPSRSRILERHGQDSVVAANSRHFRGSVSISIARVDIEVPLQKAHLMPQQVLGDRHAYRLVTHTG